MKPDLQQFVDEHPEYFETVSGEWRIRRDLRPLLERYAQVLDPRGFEVIRGMAETVRKREQSRTEEKLKNLRAELRQEERNLSGLIDETERVREEMEEREARIRRDAGVLPEDQDIFSRSRRGRLVAVIVLDLFGILFLYVGIITERQVSVGHLAVGLACILAGFVLHNHKHGGSLSPGGQYTEDEHMVRLLRVKEISLKERERLQRERIVVLERQIEGCRQQVGWES